MRVEGSPNNVAGVVKGLSESLHRLDGAAQLIHVLVNVCRDLVRVVDRLANLEDGLADIPLR